MKKLFYSILALALSLTAYAQKQQMPEKTVYVVHGQEVSIESVDLGLPSGTLWASCNLGAASPEAFGDYFAWAELLPKSHYDSKTYMHLKPEGMNAPAQSYQIDGRFGSIYKPLPLDIAGNADYDAVTSHLGGNWKIPNMGQFNELRKHCVWEQFTLNGVKGFKVKSKQKGNSNWIFLPAANYKFEGNQSPNTEWLGYYWTSTQHSENDAWAVKFNEGRKTIQNKMTSFYYGLSIRPVYMVKRNKKNKK
ncbi:MAG: hypothetical protein MJZ32_09145 [Bacteroidaceae bacterium]|nr:hypothetical protein [Bacteroidaceae bacterium]